MKCQTCGTKVVKFPIRDDNGKLIVKNLFKMDFNSIIMIIIIIAMVIGYKADIAQYEEIVEEPCTFCEKNGCCTYIQRSTEPVIPTNNISTEWKFNS